MRRARLPVLLIVFGALFLGSACTVRGGVSASYSTPAPVELVEVRPGVWVAVDHHRPLFYSDGYYWMWRDGTWLRSYSYYGGGWSVVHYRYVPYSLRHLDRHPRYYVRYSAPPNRVRYTAPRTRAERRGAAAPVRRDHRRTHERVPSQRGRDATPRTRDHRRTQERSRTHERVPAQRGRDARESEQRRSHERVPSRRGRDASRESDQQRSHERVPAQRGRDAKPRSDRSRDDRSRARDRREQRRPDRSRDRDRERVPSRRGRGGR